MKSLWIAWASSPRGVGPVIFNNKATEVKWSELSKVFTIRPAHIQPQWVMISAARAPVALIALARLFFTLAFYASVYHAKLRLIVEFFRIFFFFFYNGIKTVPARTTDYSSQQIFIICVAFYANGCA